MKKRTSKIFRHFMVILNIIACSVPMLVFAIVTAQDVFPKYFTSIGMQHHGDGSTTFAQDVDTLASYNELKDVNYNLLDSLNRLDYLSIDPEGVDVHDIDSWIAYYEGETFSNIYQSCNTHLVLNIDFISLFSQDEFVNHNGNIAFYLFMNFYMNYIINVLLILFLPEFIILFIDFIRKILYKFTDISDKGE